MKRIVHVLLLSAVITSCVNHSEEDLISCSSSNLAIDNITSEKSGCGSPGSITIEVSGGEEPYSFSIDEQNFQSSAVFNDLVAGDFLISVTDALGCTVTENHTLLSEESSISLSIQTENSDCSSDTGIIVVNASGGSGVLTFSLDNSSFQESNTFTDLAVGDYSIVARDGEGCEVSTAVTVGIDVGLIADIMPIIASNCAISGCHNGSISPNLSNSSNVIASSARVKARTQARTMPPSGRSISGEQIDLIACWVDDGAKNN
ncbi:MAG: hypothetical protein HRT61_18570 [Ekhidna sp.]|nr:hypothetical protein [Ekhidna sp.]